ncbi:hypothetical protein [Streptomyces antibioticus]|uniref:hypothetical protein n=1 Tax=Streptomyces antibioticus TaxID=1890 RepID=UPI0036FEC125
MNQPTQPDERRDRYAAAIRDNDGWVLDGGQHMVAAVMAVADAELAEARAVVPPLPAVLRSFVLWLDASDGSVPSHDGVVWPDGAVTLHHRHFGLTTTHPDVETAVRLAHRGQGRVVWPEPPAPASRPALRDQIRRAICEAEGFGWDTDMLEPDEYGEVADAVLAVLPEQADRAAVLREAAEQPTETQPRPSCPDPIECGHEAALGLAEMRLDKIREKATEWTALAPPDDWGNTPQDTALADVGRYLLRLIKTTGPAAEAQPAAPETPAAGQEAHPQRGDQFEAWLKSQRDLCFGHAGPWGTVDGLLDQYRLHADTGTPLDEHVCEGRVVGDCGCLEPPVHVGGRANAEDCPACRAEHANLPYPFLCPAETGAPVPPAPASSAAGRAAVLRKAVLRGAADAIDAETRRLKADGVLESDKFRPCRDATAQLRAMADCPACEAGIEHNVHCPTPESHNWGCGCPSDPVPAADAPNPTDVAKEQR